MQPFYKQRSRTNPYYACLCSDHYSDIMKVWHIHAAIPSELWCKYTVWCQCNMQSEIDFKIHRPHVRAMDFYCGEWGQNWPRVNGTALIMCYAITLLQGNGRNTIFISIKTSDHSPFLSCMHSTFRMWTCVPDERINEGQGKVATFHSICGIRVPAFGYCFWQALVWYKSGYVTCHF